ncbi:MAG: hypothetical protein PWQ54_1399 [Bacteroidales bacterium]|jgi:6-pyruvoyl-tetrahydropterin synthase|nr:hypothetical protein [Bacteroidales bacterium]
MKNMLIIALLLTTQIGWTQNLEASEKFVKEVITEFDATIIEKQDNNQIRIVRCMLDPNYDYFQVKKVIRALDEKYDDIFIWEPWQFDEAQNSYTMNMMVVDLPMAITYEKETNELVFAYITTLEGFPEEIINAFDEEEE